LVTKKTMRGSEFDLADAQNASVAAATTLVRLPGHDARSVAAAARTASLRAAQRG
jgi:hypothetical protein